MFDTLVSADLLVPNVQGTTDVLTRVLDLPALQPAWVQENKDWQFRVHWLRAQQDRAAAASLIEVIGPHPDSGWHSSLRHARDEQGDRPMKTHATVVAVSDIPSHLARLDAAGIPYRYSPASDFMPFDRLWIGQSGDEAKGEIGYDPKHDCGMWIELLSAAPLHDLPHMQIPQPSAAEVATGSSDTRAPGFLRVVSRSFLVDDLDKAVATVERTLGWKPSHTGHEAASTCRVAAYSGNTPGGASLEMLQPEPGSDAAVHMGRFGAGAYRITLGVGDLQERAARIERKGVPVQWLATTGQQRLRLDPAAMNGLILEMVNV